MSTFIKKEPGGKKTMFYHPQHSNQRKTLVSAALAAARNMRKDA